MRLQYAIRAREGERCRSVVVLGAVGGARRSGGSAAAELAGSSSSTGFGVVELTTMSLRHGACSCGWPRRRACLFKPGPALVGSRERLHPAECSDCSAPALVESCPPGSSTLSSCPRIAHSCWAATVVPASMRPTSHHVPGRRFRPPRCPRRPRRRDGTRSAAAAGSRRRGRSTPRRDGRRDARVAPRGGVERRRARAAALGALDGERRVDLHEA